MQLLKAKYGDLEFDCFKEKAFYNSIQILTESGFTEMDSKMNNKFNILIVDISNPKTESALTLRINNPSLVWKLFTRTMVERRLKIIRKALNI